MHFARSDTPTWPSSNFGKVEVAPTVGSKPLPFDLGLNLPLKRGRKADSEEEELTADRANLKIMGKVLWDLNNML